MCEYAENIAAAGWEPTPGDIYSLEWGSSDHGYDFMIVPGGYVSLPRKGNTLRKSRFTAWSDSKIRETFGPGQNNYRKIN